jgi:hypothetical protein
MALNSLNFVICHANGQLVAVSPDGKKVKSSPAELGCYLVSKNRTDRGLAKERIRDYWEG